MIKTVPLSDSTVRLTFVMPDDGSNISLIGTFNAWDPSAHPLKKRSNGTRSVAVVVPAGELVKFRYAADDDYFDDADAQVLEPNGFGQYHGVLIP